MKISHTEGLGRHIKMIKNIPGNNGGSIDSYCLSIPESKRYVSQIGVN